MVATLPLLTICCRAVSSCTRWMGIVHSPAGAHNSAFKYLAELGLTTPITGFVGQFGCCYHCTISFVGSW